MNDPIITAYCWASGLIGFTSPARSPQVPSGALPIITGPKKQVRHIIACCARHAHKKRPREHQRFLVPGIPEASLFGWKPEDKLKEFRDWVRPKVTAK